MFNSDKMKPIILFLTGVSMVLGILLLIIFSQFQKTSIRLKSEIKTNINLKDQIADLRGYQSGSPSPSPTPSLLDYSDNKPYFLSKIYSKFPDFQMQASKDTIKRAFQFPIPLRNDKKAMGGYLVEVEKKIDTHRSLSFYLITSEVQKELINPMSSNADKSGPGCFLTSYKIVNNESGADGNLLDRVGYIILLGKCETYGGGRFISIYRLSSGEKVMLKGNIDIGGTVYKGISGTGNALGEMRGVIGYSNPTLVVEFGNGDGAPTSLGRSSSIGFFDIKTGNLKQIVNFN